MTVTEAKAGFWAFIKNAGAAAAGMAAVGGLLAVIWPWIGGIAALPDLVQALGRLEKQSAARDPMMVRIDRKLTALEAAARPVPPPVLQFRNGARVHPSRARAGSHVFAVYMMRRTQSCPTRVQVRWWNVALGTYDPEHQITVDATEAPVTVGHQLFRLKLRLPKDLSGGLWAYQPRITPGPECANRETVVPPPAYVQVEE